VVLSFLAVRSSYRATQTHLSRFSPSLSSFDLPSAIVKMSTASEEFGARVIHHRPSSPMKHPIDGESETPTQSLLPPPQGPKMLSPAVTVHSLPEIDFDPHVGAKPCSPFYRHRGPADSLTQLKIEAQITERSADSNDLERGQCMSPGDLQKPCSAKLWARKRHSRFNLLRNLSQRQKFVVKLVIALLVLGTMVGIALGITAAVHGGVWKSGGGVGTLG
jgi:hypothetical protein